MTAPHPTPAGRDALVEAPSKTLVKRLLARSENGHVFHTDRKLFAEAASALRALSASDCPASVVPQHEASIEARWASLISMVTDYLQPATYVRRFPADATKWETEFEMPHENADEVGRREAEKRRDTAFILDLVQLQEHPAALSASNSAQPAAVPDPWQPIETAPKDGTLLILACADWPLHFIHGKPVPVKIGGWDKVDERWHIFGASWSPTHWQLAPSFHDYNALTASDAAPSPETGR